jgi:hypothetical protein
MREKEKKILDGHTALASSSPFIIGFIGHWISPPNKFNRVLLRSSGGCCMTESIDRPLAISLAKQKRLVKETLACVAVIFFFASSLFVSTLPLPLLITKWLGFLFSSSAQLRYSRHFYPPHLGCVKSLKNFLFQK